VLAIPLIAVTLALGALFGCSSVDGKSAEAGPMASASLRIAVWPDGNRRVARPVRWTLRCGPVGGTLTKPRRACKRLLSLRSPFRAVPRRAVCTQIYGGPQVAEVRGSLRGKAIVSTFKRTDGCEIQRWDRLRFLFPTPRSN
jgi:hypothetical protein